MILRKPDFFDSFKCTAFRCSDTCCVGWEIDIDEGSREAYRKVAGSFGEKLRDNIEDGHFKLLPRDRCPFLDRDNLCEIYMNLGEGALCDICREHPRFVEVYGDIMERGLGLCCEEATRLLFAGKGPLTFTSEECDEPEDELDEDDREVRDEVLFQREEIFKILADGSLTFRERLHRAFGISGDNAFAPSADARELYELLAKTESFGPAWDEALKRIKKGTFGICKVCGELIPKARLIAVPTATKCVNCKEETKRKEKEDSRLEMARMLAEAQRREMQKKAAGK